MSQWRSYWGTSKKERVQKVLESVLLAYGGMWLSWFLSFMAGSLVAACIGTALIFNWMFGPYLNSARNNETMYRYKNIPLQHAIYRGRIISLCKMRRRAGKTIGAISQEFVSIVVSDELNREMEIITPWQDEYNCLRTEMSFDTIIASPRNDFSKIVAITDSFVPACNVWVGDYPFVKRNSFVSFIAKLQKLRVNKEINGNFRDAMKIPFSSPSNSINNERI
eukprot:CAMPEP_0170080012 /NCGR_PEP_ID=MMETSP0019_2-20121128/16248_1 /TAXON_ID=98059 /ORGANISM="Dinobryon sp., Strain UTEXLB2267" /LENGTH=221 /DNA_ID=CAMNT_0010293753 /DNA_START=141 /DNA_END=803 /DNA_ORIENTATION=+